MKIPDINSIFSCFFFLYSITDNPKKSCLHNIDI